MQASYDVSITAVEPFLGVPLPRRFALPVPDLILQLWRSWLPLLFWPCEEVMTAFLFMPTQYGHPCLAGCTSGGYGVLWCGLCTVSLHSQRDPEPSELQWQWAAWLQWRVSWVCGLELLGSSIFDAAFHRWNLSSGHDCRQWQDLLSPACLRWTR